MLMDDYFIAIHTQHVIGTLRALPHDIVLGEGLAAVVTEEPIMVHFLCLRHQFLKDVLFQTFLLLFCLLSQLDLLLFLSLESFLSLFLPCFGLLPKRVLDFARVLCNGGSSRLFEPKVVLSLIGIHLLTPLFILLINDLLFRILPAIMLGGQPLLIKDVVLEEEISLI
jgi:hypothetical protein